MEAGSGAAPVARANTSPNFALEGKRAFDLLKMLSQMERTGAERGAASGTPTNNLQQLLLNPATGFSSAAALGPGGGAGGDLHSATYRVAATLLHLSIFLLGVTGNVLLVIAVRRTRSLHTSTYCYLVCLATADLLVLFSAVPDQIIAHHIGNKWISGQAGCSLMVFANFLGINAGSLSILAFTVDRYIAACRPLLILRVCNWQFARKVSCSLWLLAFVYCSPWLGLTQIKPYPRDPQQVICDFRLSHNQYTALFISDLLLFYVVPLLFAAGVYLKLGIILHRSVKDFKLNLSPEATPDEPDYQRPHISAPAALAHSAADRTPRAPSQDGDVPGPGMFHAPQHRPSADPILLLVKPRASASDAHVARQESVTAPLLMRSLTERQLMSQRQSDVVAPVADVPNGLPPHRLSADPIYLRNQLRAASDVSASTGRSEAYSFPGARRGSNRFSRKKLPRGTPKEGSPALSPDQTTARLLAMRREVDSGVSAVWIREAPKNRLQKLVRSRTRVFRMLVVIVVLFAVTWLPYRGVLVYNCFASEPWLNAYYLLFAKTCVYINCAINPYLYNIMSRRFRFALYQVLTCQPKTGKASGGQYSR